MSRQWWRLFSGKIVRICEVKYSLQNLIVAITLLITLATCQSDLYSQWARTNFPHASGFPLLVARDSSLFEGSFSSDGLVMRAVRGNNWKAASTGLPFNEDVECIATADSFLFIGTVSNGMWRSSNDGNQWTQMNATGVIGTMYSMLRHGAFLFAGGNLGIARSSDSGVSWTSIGNGMPRSEAYSMTQHGMFIFFGNDFGEIYRSSDDGNSWTRVDSLGYDGSATVGSMAVIGNNVLAATSHRGIFRSTDDGITWDSSDVGLSQRSVPALLVQGGLVFAGVNAGLFMSIDSGRSWLLANPGLTWDVISLAVLDSTLFAGVSQQGIWRCPLSELAVLSVPNGNSANTNDLEPNYPNPFSKSTNIAFHIKNTSPVTIQIIDAAGRVTTVFESNTMGSGRHEFTWDASNFQSGVYLCVLNVSGEIRTSKILLLR
jgi:photosystem II stability/assembly factor-like uncharacterized protein